jgi:hypothetical protein
MEMNDGRRFYPNDRCHRYPTLALTTCVKCAVPSCTASRKCWTAEAFRGALSGHNWYRSNQAAALKQGVEAGLGHLLVFMRFDA